MAMPPPLQWPRPTPAPAAFFVPVALSPHTWPAAQMPEASYNIGVCFGLGHNGTVVDLERAARFYKHAQRADVGAASSKTNLPLQLIVVSFSGCQKEFTQLARQNLVTCELKLGRAVIPFPTTKDPKAATVLQKIIDDPTESAENRDFARMRLAENSPAPQQLSSGMHSVVALDQVTESSAQWQRAQMYESLYQGDPVAAVRDAAAAILFDEKKVPTRSLPDRNFGGKPNAKLCYPRLIAAASTIVCDRAEDAGTQADAHVLLAFLEMQTVVPTARNHMDHAISLRPNNKDQLNIRAALFAMMDLWSLALEDMRAVRELETDLVLRWESTESIGKCLFNLERYQEMLEEFAVYVEQAFDGGAVSRGRNTPKRQARSVSALYIMVDLCSSSKGLVLPARLMTAMAAIAGVAIEIMPERSLMSTFFFKMAQEQEAGLSSAAKVFVDGHHKMVAQMIAVKDSPDAGTHRECHHCHQPALKLQSCSGCKAVAYCGRKCQLEAWKKGHKLDCSGAKQKLLARRNAEVQEAATRAEIDKLPPIDADMVPADIWQDGVRLTVSGHYEAALWKFLMALFLDFSLINNAEGFAAPQRGQADQATDMAPLRAALERCKPLGDGTVEKMVWALSPIVKAQHSLHDFDEAHTQLRDSQAFMNGKINPPRTLADQQRCPFTVACGALFFARMLERAQPRVQLNFDNANRLIQLATKNLPPSRWLTLQYELGYSNRDIGASTESLRCFDAMLVHKDRCARNPHWLTFMTTAEHSVLMIRDTRRATAELQDRAVSSVRRQRRAAHQPATLTQYAEAHRKRALTFSGNAQFQSAEREYTLAIDVVHDIPAADSAALPAEVQVLLAECLADRAECRLLRAERTRSISLAETARNDCRYALTLPHLQRASESVHQSVLSCAEKTEVLVLHLQREEAFDAEQSARVAAAVAAAAEAAVAAAAAVAEDGSDSSDDDEFADVRGEQPFYHCILLCLCVSPPASLYCFLHYSFVDKRSCDRRCVENPSR